MQKTIARHCEQKSIFSNIRNTFYDIRNSCLCRLRSIAAHREHFFNIRNSFLILEIHF